ncbi:MAG: sulfatase, partial [Gemmata sp.]
FAALAPAADPTNRPNVLVILSDDQGRGDYSAFGTKDVRTPHIDCLYKEGVAIDNFYANSPVCSPTRAALLTGCYPDRVGVPGVIREERPDNSWGRLSSDAVLLPKVLKPAGYHAAIVGKWHLGISSPNTPTDRGFGVFRGFLGDMMDDYATHRRNGLNLMRDGRKEIDPKGHATDLFTGWAVEYLEERARQKEPFFLYLAYNAPHDPLQPPAEWLDRVKKREPKTAETRAKLVALIEHMDDGIGQVLDALDRTELAKNTVVIFTSDNGGVTAYGANNGPWRSGKQHVYEGGLRVPGVVRWPGVVKPGTSTDRLTLTMDIFPTVCDVAGVKPPQGIDGVSFLPTLRGEREDTKNREVYFVRREGGAAYGGKTIEAVRKGKWKLLQDSPFAPPELYDLEADPKETTDLAAKEKKVLAEMSAALRKHVQRGGQVPWQQPEGKRPGP